jgi:hypothetical protein
VAPKSILKHSKTTFGTVVRTVKIQKKGRVRTGSLPESPRGFANLTPRIFQATISSFDPSFPLLHIGLPKRDTR